MRDNKVKEKLDRGEAVFGCQIRSRAPMIAEVFGKCGFDFVFIEGEHFPYNIESVLHLVRACECGGIEPFLRIPDHDAGKILQFLDMGVKGLFLPHCDSGDEARAIVDAGKYAPLGTRGFSNTSRATGYGTADMEAYKRQANAQTMLIPFVESKEAVERLDDILAAGVDALHVGPGDLSESYGCAVKDPVVQQAMDFVVKKAEAAGIPVAVPAATVPEAVAYLERGFRIISFSSDLMLLQSVCRKSLEEMREWQTGHKP